MHAPTQLSVDQIANVLIIEVLQLSFAAHSTAVGLGVNSSDIKDQILGQGQ